MSKISYNKMNIEALRFILNRRDELGKTFREFFRGSISARYVDMLYDCPYEFDAYHVLKKLKSDCELFFGSKDWFLYLGTYETEKKLLSALRMEDTLDIESDITDKDNALHKLNVRLYRFKILLDKYKTCDEETALEIIKGNTL